MRNAEPFVAETIRSLLAQREVELEIIVIDDGSTDRSAEVVRAIGAPQVRIIAGPQKGISAAVNAGIAQARGEYLCRCDADDLYPEIRLSRQAAFLDAHQDYGAICGAYSTIDPAGRHVADHFTDQPAGEITDEILAAKSRSHMCAYLFRTNLLRKIGGCREWFVTSEDADLQFRLAEITRVWFDPAPAYLYRMHDSSITHTQKSAQRRFFEQCAKDFLAQRRSLGQDDLQRGAPPTVPTNETAAARSSAEQIQQLLLGQAWKLHAAGQRGAAISTGFRACRARPINATAWRSLIALMIKPRG